MLSKFNKGLAQEFQINEIGELLKNKNQIVTTKVCNVAKDLGLTYNNLKIIGHYKRKRNAIAHKEEWDKSTTYTKSIALNHFEIVGRRMVPECKTAVKKCIDHLY